MTDDEAIAELRKSVQALAQPAHVQLSLFPSFAVAGDELALDFDNAMRAGASLPVPPSTERSRSLEELDAYLLSLSGPSHLAFWSDLHDPRWARARALASAALVAFGWPNVAPVRTDTVLLVRRRPR